ncbi:MAG: class I SAM-dependent methyltransferase, partial [Elusimicrobiota bacterium]
MKKAGAAERNVFHKVTVEDFARSFGITPKDISKTCRGLISKMDFRYKIIEGAERDKIILDVLRRMNSDRQVIGAPERHQAWESGWAENLKTFINAKYDLKALYPKFIRPGQTIRFNGNYISPANPNFELDYVTVFRQWFFKKYLSECDPVYEFGCGTGFNLAALAQLYPEKKLFGLDFVTSSVELVKKIGEVYKWKLTGRLFDMISPDENFRLEKGGGVFTFGAVEQIAGKFEAFLQYLIKNAPAICL